LGCRINRESKFDRKHYFYPDLPKAFQISQYDQPFCEKGVVELSNSKRIRVTRVHLEEDTGKLVHRKVDGKEVSLVDYNRSGVPLVEIVSEPDISSADEAKEYLKFLHATVRYLGVSDADMEKGSMRLEANISVSRDGGLPEYKVEVKNVNSFRYIAAAIEYEIKRQTELLEKGETPRQETRGWKVSEKRTFSQRSKEEAKDYRYFPEPDIPPILLSKEEVDGLMIEETPVRMRDKLREAGLRDNYVEVVLGSKDDSEKCLELIRLAKKNKLDVNKVVGAVINSKKDWSKVDLNRAISDENERMNKAFAGDDEVKEWISEVIKENSGPVEDYRKGKETAVKFLVGQVMKVSKGQANPKGMEKKIIEVLKKG
jgi:aspartyl-tRNA(Asn)/glutamyl-tRNA(Gln) amidotransferase subunit B